MPQSTPEASAGAFREQFAKEWERIIANGPPLSRLVVEDGEAVNLDLGGGTLYPLPAAEWTRQRMAEFASDPERLGYADPSHCNLSAVSMPLLDQMATYVRNRGLTQSLAGLPVVDVGYLFVFGVGLGHHIGELIGATPARHVVLIEPVPEFIRHACAVVDWAQVFETARERGITVHVCLESDPERICRFVEALVSREGNTFIDGSYFHPHYYSWTFKQCMELLRERLKVHGLSSGFYEDEVEMVRNCHANLDRWPFHLLETRAFREQSLPVFIVGAGPSLDADLDVIRKWRERVLLVSCGTTLGILLKHGLRPDLHCEIERGALVFDLLATVEAEYGFTGITLVASTTVDPRIGALFDKRWFVFRAALSPAVLLRGAALPLTGTDPLCCNAAFATVTCLGFREIYLFGLDLAQKEAGRHHAKDSLYFKDEHADLDEMYRKRFNRVVPGNFGGTVDTFWAFDAGRHGIARLQQYYRTRLFNCSDGARIDGAQPKVAASVNVPAGTVPRAVVLSRIEAQLRSFSAGEMIEKIDLGGHITGCEAFAAAFEAMIAEARRGDASFVALEARLQAFVADRRPDFAGFFCLALSSLVSMLRVAAFFGCRIPEAEERHAYFLHFLDALTERASFLADSAGELLRSVDCAGVTGETADA